MKRILKSVVVVVLSVIFSLSFFACSGKKDNTFTAQMQLEKAKEILTKTSLKKGDMQISADSRAFNSANGAQSSSAELTKAEILEVLRTQGLKGLATGSADEWGMTADQQKRTFLACYSFINSGMKGILDIKGEDAFNRYYLLDYKVADSLKDFAILYNPIAVRGVHRITENGKSGYSMVGTSAYTQVINESNYTAKGYVNINYFDEGDFNIKMALIASVSESVYTVNYFMYDMLTKNFEESCVNKIEDEIYKYSFFNDKAIPPAVFNTAETELIAHINSFVDSEYKSLQKACEDNNQKMISEAIYDTYKDANGETKKFTITVPDPFN